MPSAPPSGAAEVLVCEIVDDLLLGESVLTTVADARRRLLTKDAIILPQGGSLWCVAVELLPPALTSNDTTPFQPIVALGGVSMNPNDSIKLQDYEGQCKVLAPPIRLLDFDWAHAPLSKLTPEGAAGESARLPLRVHTAGVLTSLVVYLTLDLDGTEENIICTGPESANVAWDQCARHLPMALSVKPGDELAVTARHSDCYLQTLSLGDFTASMLVAGSEGERELAHLVGNPSARGLSVAMEPPPRGR